VKKYAAPLVLIGTLLGSSACVSNRQNLKHTPTVERFEFEEADTTAGSFSGTSLKGVVYRYEFDKNDRHYIVEFPAGTVVFDGPVSTAAQRAAVPPAHLARLNKFEGKRSQRLLAIGLVPEEK